MKIVKILGGLGNQMFQYALAISLKYYFPQEEVKVDLSVFNGYPLHNGYELSDIFYTTLPVASMSECVKYGYPLPNYRLWQLGSRILPVRKSMLREISIKPYNSAVFNHEIKYFDGYWQSEKYFSTIRPEIIQTFSFPHFREKENLKLMDEIMGQCCVSVHVRRGDYLNIPLYKGICSKKYYQLSLEKIQSLAHVDRFIVFSNDINWVQNNLDEYFFGTPVTYVNWNKDENSFRDMQLMSICTHNIIANSSFSWWGAWLNQNPSKIVLSPSKWINIEGDLDILPSEWMRIQE